MKPVRKVLDLTVPADFYADRAERLTANGSANVLDLGFKVTPDLQVATIDYAKRIRKGWSVWAHGEAGRFGGDWYAAGMGGLRIRW